MADDADRAQAQMEMEEGWRQAARRRGGPAGHGPTECIDCGEEIPLARRQAVPGCKRCVNCQEMFENWRPL
ncbi:MAG: TraR/DksA family transcriptional regulator [Pigmentiphaga sp.]